MGEATRPPHTLPVEPPHAVQRLAQRLEEAGFETWCVGGAVRDALLGHPHLDWDLATAATPEEVQRLFRRTVPLGVEFGTVGVLDHSNVMHEVTTFRKDVKTDGRHAVVAFGASLDEDLARRDFTINAIAYSPTRKLIHDPFGGRQDLARGAVRAVGEPAQRMREDRLRALRGLRFAARFGFTIEPETWQAIADSAPHLGRLSPERIRQELEKTMQQVDRPSVAINLWRESGALASLIPELAGVSPVVIGSLDELPRAPAASSGERERARAERRTLDRLAALFAELSDSHAESTLRALRFSNRATSWIATVAKRWMELEPDVRARAGSGAATPARVRLWVARAGRSYVGSVFRVGRARFAASRTLGEAAPPALAVACIYRRALRSAFRDAVTIGDLAIDGNDLADAGMPAGPMVGRVLRQLLEAVLEDQSLNTRDRLLALAKPLYEREER
ncbi:MAG TPA: CCA tRNA nucleotidyltransferase [Gemmatimonadaceae bacterium]|nr:CCA tRNA nucleotidyltransferase [Gemmatimonadaceae bacterium]